MKVKIFNDQFTNRLNIYFYEEHFGGKRFIVKPVEISMEAYDNPGESLKPTFQIEDFNGEFLKSLAEELDAKNIKTSNDFKIQGTMDAMKIHLDDMRKLVFER